MFDNVARSIVEGNYLQALIQAFLAVVGTVIAVILYPFSLLIETFIPELNDGLSAIAQLFTYADTYMAWLINAFAIPSTAIILISTYYLFAFSVSIGTWGVKLVLQWKKALIT